MDVTDLIATTVDSQPRVLVVDDDRTLRAAVSDALRVAGCDVTPVGDGEEAKRLLRERRFDVVVIDLFLPGTTGLDVLRHSADHDRHSAFIVITGYASVETAIEAMKAGATDYIRKPFLVEEVVVAVRQALERSRLRRENEALRRRLADAGTDVGDGHDLPQFAAQMQTLLRVAPTSSTVLIQGEEGTGKALLARVLHRMSERTYRPFVAVHCGTLPEPLLEAELLGRAPGADDAGDARTGSLRRASGGTLLLEEVDKLTPRLQAMLLGVLETGAVVPLGSSDAVPVDVRVVATTREDLAAAVAEGRFRQGLYYRLKVVAISVPPLRERRAEVAVLARHFLRRCAEREGGRMPELTSEAVQALESYPWPGNVRELESLMERCLVLHRESDSIACEDLPADVQRSGGGVLRDVLLRPDSDLDSTMREVERRLVLEALEGHEWNKSQAARALGIKRTTLTEKMKRLAIPLQQAAATEPSAGPGEAGRNASA